MDRLEVQIFSMKLGRFRGAVSLVFPGEDGRELVVVTQSFTVGRLMFLAEMPTARFVALKGVTDHELAELEEIGDAAGALQRLVVIFAGAGHAHIFPELLA